VIFLMTYFRSKFCVYFISVKWSNLMENIEKWRRCRMTMNRNKEIEQSNFSLLWILFDYKKRNGKIYKMEYHMLMLIFSTGTLQCSSILISKRGQKNKDCCFWQSHHHLCLSRSSSSLYLFIVYHDDLVECVGAHSSHVFADDLNVLITSSICRGIKSMIE